MTGPWERVQVDEPTRRVYAACAAPAKPAYRGEGRRRAETRRRSSKWNLQGMERLGNAGT